MKRINGSVLLILFSFALIFGCKSSKTSDTEDAFVQWHIGFEPLPTVYAQGFTIEQRGDHKLLTVINPWDSTTVSARYLLYKGDCPSVPAGVECIQVPVERVGVTSCTHIGFLGVLDELSTICGLSYPERVYNEQVRAAIDRGLITDFGDPFNLDIEKVLSVSPSLLWVSGYSESDDYNSRIRQSEVPVVLVNEWMEKDVLARAEWIRFIASFYDKEALAADYFQSVSDAYISLLDTFNNVTVRPKVLSGEDFRGSWYMPSEENWLAKMYADAGGSYRLPRSTSRGSISFTLEESLSYFSDSDVWMGVDARSLGQLLKSESRYRLFRAFQNGRVYHFSRRSTSTGGNDFWEQAVVEPHVLLKDFMSVFHPQLFIGYEPTYVEQLKP